MAFSAFRAPQSLPLNESRGELCGVASAPAKPDQQHGAEPRPPPRNRMLFAAALRQSVESEFKVTGAWLEPKLVTANSAVVASLSRLMHRSGADAAAVAVDAGIPAGFVRGTIYRETESLDPGPSSFVRRTGSGAPPFGPLDPVDRDVGALVPFALRRW
jgi:hypothetical protein